MDLPKFLRNDGGGNLIHYVDVEFKNHTRLIALRRLRRHHTGENMSVLLIEVIKEYGFQDHLGYFVTDDVCIELVLEALQLNLSAVQRSHHRLRCWGHMMNLAANSFLWGKEPESFEEEILIHSTLQREQLALESRRKKGPVGKLHNITLLFLQNAALSDGRRGKQLRQGKGLIKNCFGTTQRVGILLI